MDSTFWLWLCPLTYIAPLGKSFLCALSSHWASVAWFSLKVFFWSVSQSLNTLVISLNSALISVSIFFVKDLKNMSVSLFPDGTLNDTAPTIFNNVFWNYIEGWEADENTECACSTLCNLNPDRGRGFSYFELFKRIYINPKLLLIILVFFELVKV